MPKSNRKKRQRSRLSPQDALKQQIQEVTDRHSGVSVEVHELEAYKTLSFEIQVPVGNTVEEAVELSNELFVAAGRGPLDEAPGWEWWITVKRGAESLITLEEGEDLQVICTVCGLIQSRGGVCEDCYSPLPDL